MNTYCSCGGDAEPFYSCVQCEIEMCDDCVGVIDGENCAEWCERCVRKHWLRELDRAVERQHAALRAEHDAKS